MNKTVYTFLIAVLSFSMASDALAEQEKENAPKRREVSKILEDIGEPHMIDDMKVSFVGSVEVGETFFHIYSGVKKKSGYRIIIFDNTPKYLGYYDSEYEAADYAPGEIYLDSLNVDSEGNTDYYRVPIGPKGPKKTISVNGITSEFVSAPKTEAESTGETGTGGEGKTVAGKKRMPIEFREWIITRKGKSYHKRAKFVRKEGFSVILQSEESGREGSFILSELSEDDKKYVKEATQ